MTKSEIGAIKNLLQETAKSLKGHARRLFMARTVCTSKVTIDCIVDAFNHWWNENKTRFPDVDTLVLLQDNGPENSGRRTPFLARMVDFAETHQANVRLAYLSAVSQQIQSSRTLLGRVRAAPYSTPSMLLLVALNP